MRSTAQRHPRKPASRFIALRFLATAADVTGVADLFGELVLPLGTRSPYRGTARAPARSRPAVRSRSTRSWSGPTRTRSPTRPPALSPAAFPYPRCGAIASRSFTSVSWIGAEAARPPASPCHGAVHLHPLPLDPVLGVPNEYPLMPELLKDTRLGPLTETPMPSSSSCNPDCLESAPLHPRVQPALDRVLRVAVRNTRPMSSQRMRPWLRQEPLHLHPYPIRDPPNRRLQQRDPSRPPSLFSATPSKFASPVRLTAYRTDLTVSQSCHDVLNERTAALSRRAACSPHPRD